MKSRLLFCVLLNVSTTGISQTWQDTVAIIEKSLGIYLPHNPGCQLSIKRNGQLIFSKAYGMADLEHNIPLTLTSKIEAGSVSKQFTAAAILLLEQQGKLSLDDDVRKFIPELPAYGNVIKLEQMMHHTSGLKDWGTVAALTGWGRTTKTYSNDDALEIAKAQTTLNNIPGAEFIYSNSNYNLLAIVVQRVSGISLAAFTRENIFIPAGMLNTEWRDNHNRIVKDRAIAYVLTKDGYETLMPNEDAYGNGGLLTTTEDLLKWNDFYFYGKPGKNSLLPKQIKTEPLNNKVMGEYGAGLFIQEFKGQNYIQHGGATAGYRAMLELFPGKNLSIAFLSNTAQFDTSKINVAGAIKNIFITEKNKQDSSKEEPRINVSEKLMNIYNGWYKNDRDGSGVYIELKEKSLFLNNQLLIPQAGNKFQIGAFNRLAEIKDPTGLRLIIPGKDTVHYTKAGTPAVNDEYLKNYEGAYFSKETNSTIRVYRKAGILLMYLKPNTEYALKPTYTDAFSLLDFGGNLFFIKDKENKTIGMKVSLTRARNIEFKKLK